MEGGRRYYMYIETSVVTIGETVVIGNFLTHYTRTLIVVQHRPQEQQHGTAAQYTSIPRGRRNLESKFTVVNIYRVYDNNILSTT